VTRDLLVIVPSRGRPANIARLAAAFDTCTHADLLVAVDTDDPVLAEYMAIADQRGGKWDVGERRRLVGTLNHLATNPGHTDGYRYLGFMGDDHLPRTPGWDLEYVRALNRTGPGAIVYGNDLIQGENLPTQVALDRRIVDTLGYMVPPVLVHMFADNWWRDLGHQLGTLTYLPHVVVEHLHPIAQRAEWDDRYVEVNAPEAMNTDHAAYQRWLIDEMPDAVAAVKEALAR
jgi:hypothetical protein